MKINQVKQFVASNISRFEKTRSSNGRSFNLYDKNNLYRGEYKFLPMYRTDYLGIKNSLSSLRILDENRKPQMQEYTHLNKDFITIKDKSTDTLTKALPKTITTVRTIIDFIEDKFVTVRTVSRLKNNLQRISKNDPDFIYSDQFIIYESLEEKPQYDKSVDILREGSISDIKKQSRFRSNISVPFIYW